MNRRDMMEIRKRMAEMSHERPKCMDSDSGEMDFLSKISEENSI